MGHDFGAKGQRWFDLESNCLTLSRVRCHFVTDVPNAKKRKMAAKGKEAAQPAVHSSSALPTSPPLSAPTITTAPTVDVTGTSSQPGSEVTAGSASAAPKKKSPKLSKNRYLQPQRLSPGCESNQPLSPSLYLLPFLS